MHISKPCHEHYAGMPASTGGRHCKACSTTVVDFTKMSTAGIEAYFKSHAGEHICGRFKPSQAGSDAFYSRMLWSLKRGAERRIRVTPLRVAMLAVVSAMFTLSSCIMGKRADPEAFKKYSDRQDSIQAHTADTTKTHK